MVGHDVAFARSLRQHGIASAAGAADLITQYGVLPYRVDADGAIEILLITSRERRRWVVPKGNPIPSLLNHESAAREAFEEAGVEGRIATAPIGTFRYEKRRLGGQAAAIVNLYPMLVTRQAGNWPERDQRERRWFPQAEAAAAVDEPELTVIIVSFSAGKDDSNPRASLVVMGVNRFSWGYRMLRFIRAIMPREDRFFDMFERHAQILVAGADAMAALFEGGDGIAGSCRRIHEHEKAADEVTRDVLVAVRRSFITPFDRSAITALTSAMDDAIDEMWQTAKAVTLYEVDRFAPQMTQMSGLAGEAARLVAEAVPLLRNTGRNATRLHELTEAIVHLEGQADELYDAGLKTLYQARGEGGPMAFFVGREVYIHLEKVLDRFEDVADEIEGIVIDHA
jgi:predicted phosphate transport protein (TIGR00153 family)